MAEIMEQAQTAAAPEGQAEKKPGLKEKWQQMPRKKRRKIIRWIIILAVLAAVAVLAVKLLGGKGKAETQVVTDVVQYGSITSTVENSGLTKAKKSETITLTTEGTVQEVLVTEGQKVTAGTPLFVVESCRRCW